MKRLEKFKDFNESTDYRQVMQARREEADKKSIDYMLGNAILFQRMKLTKQMEDLEKAKKAIEIERDNCPYYKSDPNMETNPVALEYFEKIQNVDSKIAEVVEKIEKLKE